MIRHKHKERIVELDITELSRDGHGLGIYTGETGVEWTIEVPFTIPGDRVKAKLLRKRGGVYSSIFVEMIKHSPVRITPRCIHFAVCGGCRWQQQSYTDQLRLKEEIVRDLFDRFVVHNPEAYLSIIPCDPPWNYRNKMEFSFSENVDKDHFLGLVMQGSRGKVLNLSICHLVNPWFIEALSIVRAWWEGSGLDAYNMHRNTGSLRTLTIREGQRTGDRMAMLTVSGHPDYALSKAQISSFVEVLRAIEPKEGEGRLSIFVRIQQIAKGVPTNFYEMHLHGPESIREVLNIADRPESAPNPLTFNISPTAFFQPNTRQAEKLYSNALQHLAIKPESVVYDLYCGTGTLSICAAKKAKQVIGIEITPQAVLDAQENAKENKLTNIEFIDGDVGAILSQARKDNRLPKPDIVMVDPPRSGLSPEAVKQIVELHPSTILYVSCNPVTQARDVEIMIAEGYKITVIQPVDQFPHTIHVENIVVLKKQ